MLSGLLRALFCASIVTGVGTRGIPAPISDLSESDLNLIQFNSIGPECPIDCDEIGDTSTDFEAGDSSDASRTQVRRLRITAYADRGLTAAGVPSGVGQCAAPADVPFGSLVFIPELGRTFVVTDRTAQRFRTNTIDIFIPDRSDCFKFGRRQLDVLIYLPDRPHHYGSLSILNNVAAACAGDLTIALANQWQD